MTISKYERTCEIQSLRTLADLLELYGALEGDDSISIEDVKKEIISVINNNFLPETPNLYSRSN